MTAVSLPALGVLLTLLTACAARQAPRANTLGGLRERTRLPVPSAPAARNTSTWPPGLGAGSVLSSDDAAAVALWNNRQLQADLAAIGIARGDLIDAGLLRNPRLDMLMPVGAKPFELLLHYPVEVFWQRGRRVEAAGKAYDQLANGLVQNGLNVVRDARLAHADLLLALARAEVAQRAAQLRSRIAELTEARLRAGDISELDAMAARGEKAAAEELLIRQTKETKVAAERLRFVLGLSLEDAAGLPVRGSPVNMAPPPSPETLLEKAMSARADLKAAEIAIAAAVDRARWERSRRLALLSGQLSSKGIGTNGILTGPGISAELPLFHRNQGLIARADADVEVAARQYLALKQRVAFEVREASALLLQAQAGLAALQAQVLPALQRTATLAEDQYKKGDAAYLFVLEQSRGWVDAQLRVADSEAAVRRSMAQLERSVGTQ